MFSNSLPSSPLPRPYWLQLPAPNKPVENTKAFKNTIINKLVKFKLNIWFPPPDRLMNSLAIVTANCPVGLATKFLAVLINPVPQPRSKLLLTKSGGGRLGGGTIGILWNVSSWHKHEPKITNNKVNWNPFEKHISFRNISNAQISKSTEQLTNARNSDSYL